MTKLAFIKHRITAGIRDEGGVVPALKKASRLLLDGGFNKLLLGDSYHLTPMEYREWVVDKDSLSVEQLAKQQEQLSAFAEQPKFSIIIPCFETPIKFLTRAVDSVRAQTYSNWEICLADDASKDRRLHAYLSELAGDPRIKVSLRSENGHISQCSNTALETAEGDWVVLLDHDDELSIDALFEIAQAINEKPDVRMIYSDEDKLDNRGRRARPYFKPEFNLELLRQNNYICHVSAYRRDDLVALGGFRVGFEGAQDHDLALRYCERLGRHEIARIPKILYHWREHSGSTAVGMGVKSYALQAGQRAVEEHLARVGIEAAVAANTRGYFEVRYALPEPEPSVAIIIPTRNQLPLLEACVESVREHTTYTNYRIWVVDNDSDCPDTLSWLAQQRLSGSLEVIKDEGAFNFSRLNNYAVSKVDTDFVVLLNNDIEVVSGGWLSDMVATACQPDVGAVGARLLYPDGTVQHSGVVLGIGGSAGHAFKGMKKDNPGYWFRGVLRSEFTAVTGACLLVAREHYLAVGGLDELSFAVAFNDVDFCLRLAERGYRNVLCAYAELIHHESKSRGYEDTPEKLARFNIERTRLRQRWLHWINDDPAYNPNLNCDTEFFGHDWRHSERTRVARSAFNSQDDLDGLSQLTPPASPDLIALLKRVLWEPTLGVPIVVVVGEGFKELVAWLAHFTESVQVVQLLAGEAADDRMVEDIVLQDPTSVVLCLMSSSVDEGLGTRLERLAWYQRAAVYQGLKEAGLEDTVVNQEVSA